MAQSQGDQCEAKKPPTGKRRAPPELSEETDIECLVAFTKEAQINGYEGAEGGWKVFAKKYQGKLGPGKADPALQTFRMLAGFARSFFDQPKRVLMLRRHLRVAAQKRAESDLPKKGASEAPAPPPAAWEPVMRLVEACRSHPRYKSSYSLPSTKRGWKRVQRRQMDFSQPPRLVAIDCEMCDTTLEDRTLVKVSAVDADGKLLLDRMVLPRGDVTDFKEEITGLSQRDLDGVTLRRRAARKQLLKLLGSPASTVLVGHSLNNDLLALRLDWEPVIDTSMLFSYKGLPRATPGLAHLAAGVLEQNIRQSGMSHHDSVEDAAVSMELVRHAMEHEDCGEVSPPEVQVEPEDLCKLMVHSIPKEADQEQVEEIFLAPQPKGFEVIDWDTRQRKLYAIFKTREQADAAFEAFKGSPEADTCGRPQKRVALIPSAGSSQVAAVAVRKMYGGEGGLLYGRVMAQPKLSKAKSSSNGSGSEKSPHRGKGSKRARTSSGGDKGGAGEDGGGGRLEKARKTGTKEAPKKKKAAVASRDDFLSQLRGSSAT